MEVVVAHDQLPEPETDPEALPKTSYMAFPAFPTNLEAIRDGYQAVPEQTLSPRGFLSLLLEPAQIEAVPSVGFALPPCPWLSQPREAQEFTDLSWIIRWK